MIINILIMVAVLGWLLAIRFYKSIRLMRIDIIKLAILRGFYCDNADPEEWKKARAELENKMKELGASDHAVENFHGK